MAQRILNIGSSNIDLIMKMERLPRVGESVTDAVFVQTYGGKGANQALAAARAGGRVSFVNCVGDDEFAPGMLAGMRADGVDVSNMQVVDGALSGTALIMIGKGGDNYLSVAPGANYHVTPPVLEAMDGLFDDVAVIMLQYEIPVESLYWVIERAEERRIDVMWNVAPAREIDMAYLRRVRYLVVNETEGEFLSGVPFHGPDDAPVVAARLAELGASTVILTMGRYGSYLLDGGVSTRVPAYPVDAVDATAAGDCYCGALAVALAEGRSIPESAAFASVAAGLAASRLGAQPSLPYRDEIDRAIAGQEG
jgi:ribokinase